MPFRDIVVIGSSAGGIEVLMELASCLPVNFRASVFIVQHLSPYQTSHLPKILSNAGPLKAAFPLDGEPIQKGHIYLAPPDHHLLVEKDRVLVRKGPKENRFRPSIDALFRSAAYTYESRVIGVVLSGLLDDGTSGLWSIKRLGGIAIVQNPVDSPFSSMPENALRHVQVDHQVNASELGELLAKLVEQTVPEPERQAGPEAERMNNEIAIAAEQNAFDMGVIKMGSLSLQTCPECHGSLVAIREGNITRYRCHTGHAYTSNILLAEVTKKVEESLWNAVRGLEESIMLLEENGRQLEADRQSGIAERFFQKAKELHGQCENIRKIIFEQEQLSEERLRENHQP